MIRDLSKAISLLFIFHQAPTNKIFTLATNPHILRKNRMLHLNTTQILLHIIPLKRNLSIQQFIIDNPNTPNIRFITIRLIFQYLRALIKEGFPRILILKINKIIRNNISNIKTLQFKLIFHLNHAIRTHSFANNPIRVQFNQRI